MTTLSSRLTQLVDLARSLENNPLVLGCDPDQPLTDAFLIDRMLALTAAADLGDICPMDWEPVAELEFSDVYGVFDKNLAIEEKRSLLVEYLTHGMDWYGADVFRGVIIYPVFTMMDDLYEYDRAYLSDELVMALILINALDVVFPEGFDVDDDQDEETFYALKPAHLVAAAMEQAVADFTPTTEEIAARFPNEPYLAFILFWLYTELAEENPWLACLGRNEQNTPWTIPWDRLATLKEHYTVYQQVSDALPDAQTLMDPFWVAGEYIKFHTFDTFALSKVK
ncbi:hypothetical protein KQH40_00740 [bacterium]|nr:hypothetical protein [bacterium]